MSVSLQGISKAYGDCVANAEIHLEVGRGTIHAVIGENGAGKSTAMKILYGMVQPDAGEIRIDGELVRFRSPQDAIRRGIGMVHQHFMLADPLSAVDNILVGAERGSSRFGVIDRDAARAKLRNLAETYGLQVSLDSPVEDLTVGTQQRIEILKALYREARILILDEPTAVLTPQETQELFTQLRRLRDEGRTVILITHKLKEVMAVADAVTIFRAGRVVGSVEVSKTSVEDLAERMVGRKVKLHADSPPAPRLGEPVLEARDLRWRNLLCGVSLEVRSGEIVGIAGVEGNGQSELLHAIFNQLDEKLDRASGEVRILGKSTRDSQGPTCTSAGIRALGVGYIPSDRHREALLLDRSLEENFLLGHQRSKRFSLKVAGVRFLRRRALASDISRALEENDVRPRNPSALACGLSGGNQQKLVIAREMLEKPKFLVASQPTRGVDVGAIESIHQRLLRARGEGAGILLVSSELDEILALSDRILVMYQGRIAAEFARGAAREQELGLAMGGANA